MVPEHYSEHLSTHAPQLRRHSWGCASLSTYADPDAPGSDGEASTAVSEVSTFASKS